MTAIYLSIYTILSTSNFELLQMGVKIEESLAHYQNTNMHFKRSTISKVALVLLLLNYSI